MNYFLHLTVLLAIYGTVAMSLTLLVGFCGRLSLMHGAMLGVGAYSYAVITMGLSLGFVPAALMGAAIAALLSLTVSFPARRFRGEYFIILSLAAQELLHGLLYNLTSVTNGPAGLLGVPRPSVFAWTAKGLPEFAVFAAAIAAALGLVLRVMMQSPWGRLLKAIRDDAEVVSGLGKDPARAEMAAFAISCAVAAVAGCLYAAYTSFIEPSLASLDQSILIISMVLVGGAGTFRGSLVGPFVLIAIPELLRCVDISGPAAANFRLLAYGCLLVLIVRRRPQGLAGDYRLE